MDLLIECEKYVEAANVYERLQKEEWFFALRNPIIPMLYAISLYKQVGKSIYKGVHVSLVKI